MKGLLISTWRRQYLRHHILSMCRSLYELWGSKLYEGVRDEDGIIVNLASKEYSRRIEDLSSETEYIFERKITS